MTESKWMAQGPVGAQRFVRVEHSETGAIGYRLLSWHGQHPLAFGPVYSSPNCMSAAECLECGIPVSEADRVLCGTDGDGALVD